MQLSGLASTKLAHLFEHTPALHSKTKTAGDVLVNPWPQTILSYLNTQSIYYKVEGTQHNKFYWVESESDSKANAFTKQYVPTCSGSYPRLAYQSGQWRCIAAIDCKKVKSGSVDWEADPVTGKCKRPAAVWKTTNWSGNCNASPYTQTRSVNCYKEGTSTKLSSATCSLPKPATSRECAN